MANPKNILQEVAGKLVVNPELKTGGEYSNYVDNSLPWEDNAQIEKFFPPIYLDATKADKLYPYRLLVIDVTDNSIVHSNIGGYFSDNVPFVKYSSNTGGVTYNLSTAGLAWEFRLPITPQQLTITDQFAINTSATMRGVVEEHNGVKFKIISAQGTTGIWPTRNIVSFDDANAGAGIALFGGTTEALGQVQRAADTLVNQGNIAPKIPKYTDDKDGQTTGYFQARLLQQFLEQYAIAKKDPKNNRWRLVFDCAKTNEAFVVTPITFTTSKSQRSPGEEMFNMQFKAWKRVVLKGNYEVNMSVEIKPLDQGFFQKITSTLDNARSLMSASLNVIKAVRADFRKPFDTLRKVTLLMKDFGGIGFSVSDLPNQISQDISSATKKRSTDLAAAAGGSSAGSSSVGSKVAQQKIKNTIAAIKADSDKNEGQSADYVQSGGMGNNAKDLSNTSSLNNVFSEPEANFDFFKSVSVDELQLTPKQRAKIEDEIELNSLISLKELKDNTIEIQNLILDLTNNFGAGDAFYAETYNRPQPKERALEMTVEEFELINSLENVVLEMNLLTATRQFDDTRSENSLEYVGGLAQDSQIPFNSSSTSKYLAPVPFGYDIEEISARYLGDPDRYNEIITLNNLRSPYIDEDGFFYDLLSNGDGRQFNISSNENLYVGQKIRLSSNTVPFFTRKISGIERITDTNYLITVDGLADLNNLALSDNAKTQAFLPGTVNSQNQIFIPSDLPTNNDPRTYDIPYLKEDTLNGISKVDWLLTDSGDLVINSFGEVGLAAGLNNLVQALKMKVSTKKGALLSNPNFGIGLVPGVNVTDVTIEEVLRDLRSMVISDSRFSGVENIELNILPPTVSIKINAVLADGQGIFPINFTL